MRRRERGKSSPGKPELSPEPGLWVTDNAARYAKGGPQKPCLTQAGRVQAGTTRFLQTQRIPKGHKRLVIDYSWAAGAFLLLLPGISPQKVGRRFWKPSVPRLPYLIHGTVGKCPSCTAPAQLAHSSCSEAGGKTFYGPPPCQEDSSVCSKRTLSSSELMTDAPAG